MKRKDQKVATRARILEAAKKVLRDRDERDASIQEIAAEAGTSVGALYVHFVSREGLVDAVVADLHGEFIGRFRERLLGQTSRSVTNVLRDVATFYVAAVREARGFVPLLASHSARTATADVVRVGGGAAPVIQMLNATMVSVSARVPVSGDLALLVNVIASVWRGVAISAWSRPKSDDPVIAETLAQMTVALLVRANPELLELDGRAVSRAMVQYLKQVPVP
ncbi:MAG: TetR/AcrR family transcriptional regulator [Polyangiaceae bacterium]